MLHVLSAEQNLVLKMWSDCIKDFSWSLSFFFSFLFSALTTPCARRCCRGARVTAETINYLSSCGPHRAAGRSSVTQTCLKSHFLTFLQPEAENFCGRIPFFFFFYPRRLFSASLCEIIFCLRLHKESSASR